MLVDVNLFGGRGGAARGGVIGRPARGGARNRVSQTDRQRLVDPFEAGEDLFCLSQVTMAKRAAWCGRVYRYMSAAIVMQPIVD